MKSIQLGGLRLENGALAVQLLAHEVTNNRRGIRLQRVHEVRDLLVEFLDLPRQNRGTTLIVRDEAGLVNLGVLEKCLDEGRFGRQLLDPVAHDLVQVKRVERIPAAVAAGVVSRLALLDLMCVVEVLLAPLGLPAPAHHRLTAFPAKHRRAIEVVEVPAILGAVLLSVPVQAALNGVEEFARDDRGPRRLGDLVFLALGDSLFVRKPEPLMDFAFTDVMPVAEHHPKRGQGEVLFALDRAVLVNAPFGLDAPLLDLVESRLEAAGFSEDLKNPANIFGLALVDDKVALLLGVGVKTQRRIPAVVETAKGAGLEVRRDTL